MTAQYSAVLAGLTVAASTATFNSINYDDILAVARPYADKKRAWAFSPFSC